MNPISVRLAAMNIKDVAYDIDRLGSQKAQGISPDFDYQAACNKKLEELKKLVEILDEKINA